MSSTLFSDGEERAAGHVFDHGHLVLLAVVGVGGAVHAELGGGAELDEVAERHLGAALERAAVHAGAVAAAKVLDEELAFSRPYREVAGGHGLVGQHQVALASAPHEEDAPADQEAGARSFRYQQLKLVHAASIARRMWRAPERLVTAL